MKEKNNLENIKYYVLDIINEIEGGYAFYTGDSGGETYKGISRNNFPNEKIWKTIDSIKKELKLTDDDIIDNKILIKKIDKLLSSPDIDEIIFKFYNKKFITKYKIDKVFSYEFKIGLLLFNISINFGGIKSIKLLQEGLNYLNLNNSLYPRLSIDGLYGRKTSSALRKNDPETVFGIILSLQGKHYLTLFDKNKKYRKFRGWFKRITQICKYSKLS